MERTIIMLSISVAIPLFAFFIGLFGYCNSLCRGADNFKYARIFVFGLYTWHYFSDVLFCALLYFSKISTGDSSILYYIIFSLSILFIIIPLFLNFHDLYRFSGLWEANSIFHADRYRAWLSKYFKTTLCLSFLSGSTFGVISLVNSNFLGSRLFAMGLSKKDMREYNQRRLFTVVIVGNVPLLLFQIVYITVSSSFEWIAFLAICSSSFSICIAILRFISNRKLLTNKNGHESFFCLKVSCKQNEFIQHMDRYKNKTYKLSIQIAKIFPLDRSCVEILPTEQYSDIHNEGLIIYFLIATSQKQPMEIYQDLLDSIQNLEFNKVSVFGRQIAKSWGLKYDNHCKDDQQVKTYDLQFINGNKNEVQLTHKAEVSDITHKAEISVIAAPKDVHIDNYNLNREGVC